MVEGWETVEDAAPWVGEVLDGWFELPPGRWFDEDAGNASFRDRFEPLWEEQRRRPVSGFLDSPAMALAAILLFDRFPRRMFRGTARASSTDLLALGIAEEAILRGYDAQLGPDQRRFLSMPLRHGGDVGDVGGVGDRHHASNPLSGDVPAPEASPGPRPDRERGATGDRGARA